MVTMTKQKHFYLIRGLIRESRHWGNFSDFLKAEFPDCLITYIEIPGAGSLFKENSPLSVNAMVKTMREEYLKNKTKDEEAVLVAISLGGMIACEWVKNYPEDFHSMALINTSFGDVSPLFHRLKFDAIKYLLKVPLLKGKQKEEWILKLVKNHTHDFEEVLDLWAQIQTDRPVAAKNALRQLFAAATFRLGNFRPAIPVVILGSTNDRMVSVECSRAISKKWNVPLYEHPTGGHDLSADDSKWISEKIKESLGV